MEEWARKIRRSGYSTTNRHQVIKQAIEKYGNICVTEDEGGRPIHRSRELQKAARRLDKETKPANWHKTDTKYLPK